MNLYQVNMFKNVKNSTKHCLEIHAYVGKVQKHIRMINIKVMRKWMPLTACINYNICVFKKKKFI